MARIKTEDGVLIVNVDENYTQINHSISGDYGCGFCQVMDDDTCQECKEAFDILLSISYFIDPYLHTSNKMLLKRFYNSADANEYYVKIEAILSALENRKELQC